MSATNRGSKREANDFYPTPAWCVHSIYEALGEPRFNYLLEPCVGNGAIVEAWPDKKALWCTYDLVPGPLSDRSVDFLKLAPPTFGKGNAVITNPPYSKALEFVEQSMKFAPVVIMLLRLNFLGSDKRNSFLRANPPDVYVLPNRPQFVRGATDNCEYAWFVWGLTEGRHLEVLPSVPKEIRNA